MEQKNKKILIILIAVIAFIAIAAFFLNKGINRKTTPPANNNQETKEAKKAESPDSSTTKTVIGKITAVDIKGIKVTTESGEELSLGISQEKNTIFLKKTKDEENNLIQEEIGLFDLPSDKNAMINFNSQTNEVTMVTVIDLEPGQVFKIKQD